VGGGGVYVVVTVTEEAVDTVVAVAEVPVAEVPVAEVSVAEVTVATVAVSVPVTEVAEVAVVSVEVAVTEVAVVAEVTVLVTVVGRNTLQNDRRLEEQSASFSSIGSFPRLRVTVEMQVPPWMVPAAVTSPFGSPVANSAATSAASNAVPSTQNQRRPAISPGWA